MMKKFFQFSMLTAAMLLWTACGGNVVDEAVSAAEQEVETTESPALGKLPSLQKQYDAAKKHIKDALQVEKLSLSEMSKKAEQRTKALDELKTIYEERFLGEAKALEGKAVKVAFDDEYFSDCTATVVVLEGSDFQRPVGIELKLTLAKPMPKGKSFFGLSGGPTVFSWKYQDARDNELSAGVNYIENADPALELQAGDVYTYLLPAVNLPSRDKAQLFDHLYIGKPEA